MPFARLADDVGGCRRDKEQIDRRGERDVLDVGVASRLVLIGDDAPTVIASKVTGPTNLVAAAVMMATTS